MVLSKEFASPLTLELSGSVILKKYFIVIHALAVFAVCYAEIDLAVQLFLFTLVLFHYLFQTRYCFQIIKIVCSNDNEWRLINSLGESTETKLTPMSFLSSWLVILAFKSASGKRQSVLIAFDSLSEASFRQLKVKLTTLRSKDVDKAASHGF